MNKTIQAIITNSLLIPLFFILSLIVKKSNNLFLLGSGFGEKFIGNTKYFYLWLNKHKGEDNFKYYWLTNNKKIFNELSGKGLPVVKAFSVKGVWYLFRAYSLIVEQSSLDVSPKSLLFGKFNVINTWHGTPIKDISADKVFTKKSISHFLKKIIFRLEQKNYKLILASSPKVKQMLREGMENKNIKVLGYPRNDVFYNKDLVFHNWRESLGISGYKKVFLYAPTFRDYVDFLRPFSDKFLKKLNDYLLRNNILLLMKSHPLSGDELILEEHENIKNITGIVDDIQEILIFTDLLIADYSSLIFDFLLTNKPIIFYPFDYTSYINNCRRMYLDYYKELPGPFVNKEDELLDIIKTVNQWFETTDYKKRYNLFTKRFNKYRDGRSSERFFSFLKEINNN